mgnify:CR=1 FL=1
MRYVKWTLITLLVLLVGSFLHYTLPQNDIVRIVNTENRRIDFGENAWFWASPDVGTAAGATRDVFFIQTVRANGRPMVYRNEDTGWGWPPYFKINSHNLQTRASNLTSTAANPTWVAIRHYGWRNEFLTIFPNAISLREVENVWIDHNTFRNVTTPNDSLPSYFSRKFEVHDGQVDITNGKFVFQCTEAYLIEDGKITAPVRGATLIGDGATALTQIQMIGDDFAFDPGVGTCGKAGQGVPVGIGQPSLKIGGLTVGGTAV